ncbi:hypothetical protein BGZ96_001517 [Linnemannia gamsii]|uniref:Transmembrane protein n=1 Tax=Linnemannia gamsii TaxID=64522 RepID=A0ABQ7JN88_9FUNG|nr:hypothetical protein BGZ96_001517 [Linnemannia gamsii]
MGVLNLICITTDPGSTAFYGFAYANTYTCKNFDGCSYNVLVKSNSNPSNPKAMTWTLVSMINSRNMTGFPSISGDVSCASNAQGVFTMFAWNSWSGTSVSKPFGLRYDPAGTMDAQYNFKGQGAWMNITIDNAYNWKGLFDEHKLEYANTGATSDLIHTVLNKNTNTIYLAKVDDTTKTLTAAGNWTMNSTIHGVIQGIGIGNNHLYTFGSSRSYRVSSYLTGFPLTTISPTTPVGMSYNTSQIYQTLCSATYLYYYQNVLTLICGNIQAVYSSKSAFYKITDPDNANSTGPPTNFTNEIAIMDFFAPLGDGTGPTSFALMKNFGSLKVFGNDNGFRYTHIINNAKVTDPVGVNSDPNPPSTDSDSSSTAAIIGVILGVMFVGVLIFWLVKRNLRNNKANATNPANKPLPPFPPVNNYGYPQQPRQNGGGPNYYNPAGQHLASAHPLKQNTPTTVLPMAPIAPIPQQVQSMQEQMQALQFSTHPRPNFITTGYGGEPEPSNAMPTHTSGPFLGTAGLSTAPWQPTPFVPPARPASSVGAPTSSGGGSPAAATAFSSAAPQSLRNPQASVSQYSVDSPTSSVSTPLSSPPSVPRNTRPNP